MIYAKKNDLIYVLLIGNYMRSSANSTTFACYRLVNMCVARWFAACDRLVDLSNARQIAYPSGYVTGR